MSLVVWLPLTKDLRQQGLSNVTITNNGATFNSAGKLGGCYSVDNVKQIGCNNCLNLGTTFSIAFWSKINSKNVDWGNIFKIYKDGADFIGMCLAYTTDANPKLGFHIYRNNGSNAREAVIDGYKEYSLNNWFHTVITVTPTKAIVYKDGIVFNTFTINKTFPSITNYSLWLGKNGIGNGLDCSINDFRIYDHCLSPMEVKEIAKGLMLHYPLNRSGLGQENFYTGNGISSLSNTSSFSNDGYESTFVLSAQGGVRASNLGFNGKTGPWTASFDIKSSVNTTIGIDICDKGYNIATYGTSLTKDVWTHKSFIVTTATNQYNVSGNYNGFIDFNCGAAGTYNIKNLKIEEGTIETPWCPSLNHTLATTMGLNSTIEYDCSGYCNNGTRTGTFSWINNTPRYNVSTAFEKGIISIPNSFVITADPIFSVSLWFKLKSGITYTAYTDLISFSSSSYSNQPFRLELCGTPVGKSIMWFRGPSGQSGGFAVKSDISTDEWYHTVLVSEGNKQYSYYVNGEKLGAYNGSANSWTPTGNVSLGENINGVFYESDIRIYATALSAEDVLELYHTAAHIDNLGNTWVYQYNEI